MVVRDPGVSRRKASFSNTYSTYLGEQPRYILQQWKDAEHDGQKVLNEAALKEVNNVRVHMRKGCLLSYIFQKSQPETKFVRSPINNFIVMKMFFKNLPAQMTLGSSGFNLCFKMSVAYIEPFLAIRSGDWHLRMASIKQMVPICTAFDHQT